MKYYIFENTYFWDDGERIIPIGSIEITKEVFDAYYAGKDAIKADFIARALAKNDLLESMLNDQVEKLKANPNDESVAQAVKDYVISV